MSVRSLCNKLITVQQNTGVNDGKGGQPENWSDLWTGVPARFVAYSIGERARFSGLPVVTDGRFYVPDCTKTITEAHRIILGSRTFRVTGVNNPDLMDRFQVVNVQEIT